MRTGTLICGDCARAATVSGMARHHTMPSAIVRLHRDSPEGGEILAGKRVISYRGRYARLVGRPVLEGPELVVELEWCLRPGPAGPGAKRQPVGLTRPRARKWAVTHAGALG